MSPLSLLESNLVKGSAADDQAIAEVRNQHIETECRGRPRMIVHIKGAPVHTADEKKNPKVLGTSASDW